MAMVRRLGFIFGMAFLFGGILGFVPGVIRNDLYLGIFRVNAAHNLLHLVSGAAFVIAAAVGSSAARWWFRIFGVVYAVMAVEGLKVGAGIICGCISNNRYDAWGHAGLALAMLCIGFLNPAHIAFLKKLSVVGCANSRASFMPSLGCRIQGRRRRRCRLGHTGRLTIRRIKPMSVKCFIVQRMILASPTGSHHL